MSDGLVAGPSATPSFPLADVVARQQAVLKEILDNTNDSQASAMLEDAIASLAAGKPFSPDNFIEIIEQVSEEEAEIADYEQLVETNEEIAEAQNVAEAELIQQQLAEQEALNEEIVEKKEILAQVGEQDKKEERIAEKQQLTQEKPENSAKPKFENSSSEPGLTPLPLSIDSDKRTLHSFYDKHRDKALAPAYGLDNLSNLNPQNEA